MAKIAVITDTDASFSQEFAVSHGITMVPIMVQFGEEGFRDTFDITNSQVFSRIDKEGKLPTTSAPSPGQFRESFLNAFNSGYESVICFTVSSEVSATYASAVNARNEFPDKDISIIDSKSLTMQQGYMVLAAAESIDKGSSKEEAIAAALNIRDRSYMFAALSTLKYLAMSGRVGHIAAGFANLLDVKPILTIRNGKLDLLEKIRTQKKAWSHTIELISNASQGKIIERISVIHVNVPEKAEYFKELLKSSVACPDLIETREINPGLSVHSGAGMVGAVVVTAD